MDHSGELKRLSKIRPVFKMTPRRKEVLWHIAYDGDLRMKSSMNWAKHWSDERVLLPFLAGVDVTQIVRLLCHAKLARWVFDEGILHITPFGMEVLLNGVPESNP